MKGLRKNGKWVWTKRVIDTQTVHDRWHTAPAIGIDDKGFIHIAYNMHNLPWQYQISTKSESIDSFNFKGQRVSVTELQRMKFKNKTDFPTLGLAAIPGNQITYPAFFNDNNGELFVSYRFAAKPARKFANRTMGSGVANMIQMLTSGKQSEVKLSAHLEISSQMMTSAMKFLQLPVPQAGHRIFPA